MNISSQLQNDDEFFMFLIALNSKTHSDFLLWKVDNHAMLLVPVSSGMLSSSSDQGTIKKKQNLKDDGFILKLYELINLLTTFY
jgi:hypothetical protein